MITRKSLLVVAVSMLLIMSVSACTVGSAMMPDREVSISTEAAVEGQQQALQGMMTGNVTLTEEQLSSLITVLLQQSAGPDVPISGVTAAFDPDAIYLDIALAQPVGGIDSIGLVGNVMIDGNTLMVDLSEAHAGPYVVGSDVMGVISDRINDAMEEIAVMPISISTEEGALMIDMAQ
jgi:hypothetical protein